MLVLVPAFMWMLFLGVLTEKHLSLQTVRSHVGFNIDRQPLRIRL